jgi:hypothetical protein
MSRAKCAFTKAAISRAVRAVVDAGVPVTRVEVDGTGKIIVFVGKPGEQTGIETNDFDVWMAKHAGAA